MSKDFEDFKRYFKEYQKRFGLTGYQIFFTYEPLRRTFAQLSVDQNRMSATASLNSKLDKDNKPYKNVKLSAKHEAIHLLLARLVNRGMNRYIAPEEIEEAEEEVVFKLEELISE